MKNGRTTIVLKDQQKFQLWERLRALLPEFNQERPTLLQAAERLTKELGFPVTFRHIQHAFDSDIVPRWIPRRASPVQAEKDWQEKLTKRVFFLESQVQRLEGLVKVLCQEWDIKEEANVPEGS